MLRIKRSVSAGYSQVCSLIFYNQVFLRWIPLNYVLLFCLNSTMLVYCRVLCTLSITWSAFHRNYIFDLNVQSLFKVFKQSQRN
ncbi:unnamed protein product [Brassica oleracea]